MHHIYIFILSFFHFVGIIDKQYEPVKLQKENLKNVDLSRWVWYDYFNKFSNSEKWSTFLLLTTIPNVEGELMKNIHFEREEAN